MSLQFLSGLLILYVVQVAEKCISYSIYRSKRENFV